MSSGVGGREGGREASRVAKNLRGGYRQGVGGGVESPSGINTPGVKELHRGDKTSRVTPEGDGVPGEDGRGRGGDENPPTTQETKERGDSGRDKEMTIRPGPGPAPPPIPQRVTAADRGSAETLHRHPDGARSERASEYSLLAPVDLAGDPAATETQVYGDGHESTMEE